MGFFSDLIQRKLEKSIEKSVEKSQLKAKENQANEDLERISKFLENVKRVIKETDSIRN